MAKIKLDRGGERQENKKKKRKEKKMCDGIKTVSLGTFVGD